MRKHSILGHEGMGIVESKGDNVKKLEVRCFVQTPRLIAIGVSIKSACTSACPVTSVTRLRNFR